MLKKIFVLLWISSLLLSGCAADNLDISGNNSKVRTIRAYEGTTVRIPEKAKRILTLSLGFDVMTLGMVQPERLVAVHQTALIRVYPGLLKKAKKYL